MSYAISLPRRMADEILSHLPETILVAGVVTLISMIAGHKTYSGVIDGVKTRYWQTIGCCRELTLEEQSGMTTIMYDKNDDNILGNHPSDFVELRFPNKVKVRYSTEAVSFEGEKEQRTFKGKLEQNLDEEVLSANGEKVAVQLRPTEKVFSEYTKIFNQYRDRIINKR